MRLFFIAASFLLFVSGYANSIKNIVTDFGADPSGNTSSDASFKKAAIFFNKNKGNGKLIIPYGIYIVGNQLKYPYPENFNFSIQSHRIGAYEGEDVFTLKGCINFEIIGLLGPQNQKPIIKFQSNMHMGVFDANPTSSEALKKFSSLAQVGIVLVFRNCDNINIKNIELDGNYNDFIKGGNWPPKSIEDKTGSVQLENILYGIFICESRDVTCKDLNIHHFLNGIYLVDLWENIAKEKQTSLNFSKNIHIIKCRISYSIQNNFCFAGGDSVYFNNSIFELAARDIVRYSPGAGVGIEPEGNIRSTSKNGFFRSCIFRNNGGFGIGAGSYLPPVVTTSFVFDSCEFLGSKNIAANCSANNMKFLNCNFYGKVQSIGKYCSKLDASGSCIEKRYVNDSYKKGLQFQHCNFSNQYFGFDLEVGGNTGSIKALLLTEDAPFVEINNCSFKSYNNAYAFFVNGIIGDDLNYLKRNKENNFIKFTNNKVYNYARFSQPGTQFPIPNRSYVIANAILSKNVFYNDPKLVGEQIQCITDADNEFRNINTTPKEKQTKSAPVIDITTPIEDNIDFLGEQYIIVETIIAPKTKAKLLSEEYIELLPGFESKLASITSQIELSITKGIKKN